MPFLFQFFTKNHVLGFLPKNRLVEFLARQATHDALWLFLDFSQESLGSVRGLQVARESLVDFQYVVECWDIFGLSCNSCVPDGCLWMHRLIGMPMW